MQLLFYKPRHKEDLQQSGRSEQVLTQLSERLAGQARDHWLEFSTIVASANIFLIAILAGQIWQARHEPVTVILPSVLIVGSSAFASMLAYYSIQMGAVLVFGPLRLAHVLLSFLVTGTQLALVLWPSYVLRSAPVSPHARLEGLRGWLFLFAAFAGVAALANRHASYVRHQLGLYRVVADYEKSQLQDAIGATLAGTASVLIGIGAGAGHLFMWVTIGLSVTACAGFQGLLSQSRSADHLARLPEIRTLDLSQETGPQQHRMTDLRSHPQV